MLSFRGIPDGVTAKASLTGMGEAMKEDMTDLAPVMLVTGPDEGADEDGMVRLSSVGAGAVMYTFDTGLLADMADVPGCNEDRYSPYRRRHERME